MRALSIRQPYAELILRGIKTVEYRSRSTTIVGERFWIYATKAIADFQLPIAKWKTDDSQRTVPPDRRIEDGNRDAAQRPSRSGRILRSDNLVVEGPPEWMIELAAQVKLIPRDVELPRGVIVGSAVIEKVTPIPATANADLLYRWHLAEVRRETTLRKPARHPQPAWFNPF